MARIATAFLILTACLVVHAQVAQPTQPAPDRGPAVPSNAPASMNPLGPEMRNMLSQLEQAAERISMDVGRLSVKKWKADSGLRDQAQHDINSVQSNVSATLPALISQVRSAPDSTATLFKLYRNVDALLEVARGLTESAGAFGPKSEFDTLQSDSQNLAAVRSNLAAQIDVVANANQAALTRLRTQLAQAQAAAAAAPPKRIVVDDNEPTKKATKKKKSASPPKDQAPKP